MSGPNPQPVIPIRLDYARPDTAKPLLTILQRTLLAIAAGILPLIGFCLSGFFAMIFAWRSGRLAEICLLPYHPGGAWPFYILIIYAIYCTGRIVVRPNAIAEPFARVGVYIGLAVAAPYCLLTALWFGNLFAQQWMSTPELYLTLGAAACVVGWVAGFAVLVYRIGSERGVKPTRSWVNAAAWGGLGIGGVGAALIWLGWPDDGGGAIVVTLLIAALQIWPLLAYAAMASLAGRVAVATPLPPEQRPIVLTRFFVGYGAGCGASLISALVTYRFFATHSPRICYVATAAAKGHRRFVRSRWMGAHGAVNDQMCCLWAAELVLHCVWPTGQRAIRRAYDHVGPRLARFIVHPLLADAAYLLIKPFEWAARVFLRMIVTDPAALAARLYPTEDNPTSLRN